MSLNAMGGADVTPLITDVSQFVHGVDSDAANLIDGNASTVCRLSGSSFTVRLPKGVTNNTPFRIRFTIPAGATDVPSGFAVYGLHEQDGALKSETELGHTTARITYDGGVVEYESPTFYVRDSFHDQYWDCTHMRFDCTEILSDNAEFFRLAEFQICLYNEYSIGDGAMLRNNGDIINAADNPSPQNSWYKPLVDEKGHSCWNANENAWVWSGNHGFTGLIVTPQPVDVPTVYTIKIGCPSADLSVSGKPAYYGFPTVMKWSYQNVKDGLWLEGGNLDLAGIQPGEIRDVAFEIRPEYYRIKFETLDNVGGLRIESWAGGALNTVLSRFQFYGPLKVYAPTPNPLPALGKQYPDPNKVSLNQNFFHNRLYSKVLKDFTFKHTHGIVDKTFDNNFHTDGGWLTNLDIWDEDGHLKPGVTIPGSELGVALPDFSYDAPINSSEVRPEGRDHRRQPTTTIYHEVYVIPGERVDLIPYSDIWHRSNYVEDFYRFYDYMTDYAHPDVYFLFNPKMGAYSKDGIFGGRALGKVFSDHNYGDFDWNDNPPSLRGPGGVASFYRPKVTDNDEYIDEYIAADYSQYYYKDGLFTNPSRDGDIRRFIDVDNKIIHEPIINFRHVFHVVDGRKFADESSKDVQSNEEFLAKQLNMFYAQANKDFKIRIINPMPESEGVHSNRYYRKADGTYERMGTYEIQTYRYDGYVRGEKVENMFVPDEHSQFRTVDTKLETELNPGLKSTPAWVDPDEKFYRALRCDSANAVEGTYLIRLVAKTTKGERIYIDGGDPEGMSLRDIIITFLDKDHASFELEDNIPYEHSEQYLEENFSTKSSVDFDKYMALSGNPDFMVKSSTGEGERLKYPVPWLNSEYAFGYKYQQDYGTYTIASHADCVPYSQAARSKWDRHDRLYNNTKGEKQGFFYYANAAGDPGVMARVDIPSVCVGSTLHVSAWINSMGVYMDEDYKNNEPANVNFDLIAIMKDGREVNINNYSTGYVPNDSLHCGKWMHAYYSITPDFSVIDFGRFNIKDVDHFQIVLVNNAVNSNGADYAIDDIRIYVSKPKVMASQLEPLCQGDDAVLQRIDMPFRNLVSSIGETIADDEETGKDVTVYYAIFDKDRFDDLIAKYGGFTQEVFDGSVLPNLSNGGDDRWGAMTFNTNYNKNVAWNKDNEVNLASRLKVDNIECISFNVLLEDGGLYGGKRYIAAISVPGDSDLPEWTDFDISNPCTKQAEFEIVSSTVIKVDGIVKADASDLEICENQFPVIQVDIYGIEAVTGDVKIVERTPLVDWFKGSLETFTSMEYDGTHLDEALLNFRHIYPEALTPDCEFTSTDAFRYDAAYRNAIQHFIDEGLLELASSAFLSEPVRLPEGASSAQYSVVVIPTNRQVDREIDGRLYTICNDPAELRINVTRRAPGLLNGFENIDYPEATTDVPLRAGLKQLEDNLHMPMRSLYIVTPGVTSLKSGEDNNLYLVKTNDPEFRNLESDPGAGEDGTGLRSVGEVLDVTAAKANPDRCNAYVHFADTRFKEGYYYTMRFNYAEDTHGDVTSLASCDGQAIFTIKVVAEYQMWTGAVDESSNFNNDENWRRVSFDELSGNSVDPSLVTDGDNDRTFSYSPLSFTKIIIPAGEKYPYMFAPGLKNPVEVFDGKSYINVSLLENLSDNPSAGKATTNIEYDMIATELDGTLYCRLWTANTCNQVHFKSGAEIANQQHLIYDKAWVEMEMTPGRWYTASSPLQDVVAGDMYLPTATARQTTELFKPITFTRDSYDRFRPAVYQRGWDKGLANVYELPSESDGEIRNVAVALDWSDVYNDVQERYSAGSGFSIKTDVSDMTGGAQPAKVLFRLPKDDASYEYWTQDGKDHGIENGGAITRSNSYRLNPVDAVITVTNHSAGRYFLVGNPFMAHLDMKTFLETNRNVINPKYWIMSADSQQCAVMDNASDGFVGTVDNASMVAPMQGFFVEATSEAQSIEVRFTPDMIRTVPYSNDVPVLLRSRAVAGGGNAIAISALDNDTQAPLSQAILLISPESAVGYKEREDVLLLGDTESDVPMIYTVTDNKAASINATPLADGVEIGLMAGNDDACVLRFDNVAAIDGYSLYDRATGESYPLYDGMEYRVQGSVSGRLFLAGGDYVHEIDKSAEIRIMSAGGVIRALSPDSKATMEMSVYDVAGKQVASVSGCQGFAETRVSADGFYIVVAKDSDGRVARRKVIL